MRAEHDNIKNEDWRLQAITTLAKPFRGAGGEIHPVGTPVALVSAVSFKNKKLSFRVPNITALFIDFSYNAWEAAQEEFADTSFFDSKSLLMKDSIHPGDEEKFFQAIELVMGAVVFAYSALESFANEKIPNDFKYEPTRSDKKCREIYDKEQVERWISLDVKLSEILPSIMGVKSPKGGTLWNKFVNIKTLRDRIIHKKSNDKTSASEEENSFWKDVLDEKNSNFALEAKEIMKYFFKNTQHVPRWLDKIPY